ncbi:hypothetical protein HYDPIDRAFT_88594 [Hydnomerulius pinastri MD-312]|nr:hypothetical protein HYDPIDRAFT_88594 [Hydnomerulius pinastri MD-312]
MSKCAPSLLYLTIYNPTLRPDISATSDDEDAEEQAQILFYASRDRAVSRDKMLRQVGLAKALVNFAEIFHSTDLCQNVHSQTRRMIMLSPEPNFWIHAAIELAKSPRPPPPKVKPKDKGKGKAKETDQDQQPPLEYHDGSLHDTAIRAHLLRGYDQFKLTHGSFTSILSSLGQQALELQLERFFTVWAWTWDLEKGCSLNVDLGLPLHPLYHTMLPVIDTFSSRVPPDAVTLVLTPEYVAPSSRYRTSQYPSALGRHLMTLLPPPHDVASTSTSTIKLQPSQATGDSVNSNPRISPSAETHSSNGFLGFSPATIGMSMDVRKWGWPSFGKNSSLKQKPVTQADKDSVPDTTSEGSGLHIDQSALEDAISSNDSFSFNAEKAAAPGVAPSSDGDQDHEKHLEQQDPQTPDADTPRPSRVPSPIPPPSGASSSSSLQPEVDVTAPATDPNKLQFTSTSVFVAPNQEPLLTLRRNVLLLKRSDFAVALLGNFDNDSSYDMGTLLELAACLLGDVEHIVAEDAQRSLESSLPSATKILQPKDGHIVRSGQYVEASQEFRPYSDQLYEAKQLLEREPTVVEVFSRGVNPQHWHVASRRDDHSEDGKGEAYLEVSRKEASLSDVDNVLRGLFRSHV